MLKTELTTNLIQWLDLSTEWMLTLQELDRVLKMLELVSKTLENQHKLDLEMSIVILEE